MLKDIAQTMQVKFSMDIDVLDVAVSDIWVFIQSGKQN